MGEVQRGKRIPLPVQSALGIIAILGLAWAFSEKRRAVALRTVGIGLALEFALALLLIKAPIFQALFAVLNRAVGALTEATHAGTSFVFGYLGGADAPWATTAVGSNFVFAFQTLPLILVISALSALLFYWNIIPPIVRAFAWVLRRAIGVDGPAGLATAATIFLGVVEGPLVIRPYLQRESRAGLFVIMTAGMAMVAGTVMVLYATMLDGLIPNPLGQILTASIIAAPGAIVIAFIMVPEDPKAAAISRTETLVIPRQEGDSMMSAIVRGTLDGMQLLINVVAMLIVFLALASLANHIVGLLPAVSGGPLTLQRIAGWVMLPVAWLMGIPGREAATAATLLGTKTVLNELIAYSELSKLPVEALSPRSRLIMTYALCGFANFGSLGILVGGMSAMVPERRAEILALAPRSLISGTLATCLSGAIVGVLTWP